jgi:uncharacterized protein (TIGR00299 family) protein
MKKYIRFDSVGGASGDMILAALVDLGADLAAVAETIRSFFPEQLHFHAEAASGAGLNGTRVSVHAEHHRHHDAAEWPDAHAHHHEHGHHEHGHHSHHHGHHHRGLTEITSLLETSPLSEATRKRALGVFHALAEAEAKIHGKTPDTVHFHEVGAWDSVADITGACLALEQLGVCGVSCGPLPAGAGTIRCAHGEMPNPAPATQELLAGMCVVQTEEPFELVTPTGAALLRTWTRTLERVPQAAIVLKSAFGFGARHLNGRPNVLRATLLAEPPDGASCAQATEDLLVMETNIDDCNPEWVASLADDLLAHGALDAWQTTAVMKKGRAGSVLSVLASAATAPALRALIFRATTTFGIRFYSVRRETLERRMETVQTPYGEVPVKLGFLNGERITVSPEHDACAGCARAHGVSVRQVSDAARAKLP